MRPDYIMTSKDNHTEEFDIIDFDLNEFDEEFEKEEQKIKLKETKKESAGSRAEVIRTKLQERENTNEPNQDMLKTILFILFVIVIACLFLGLISYMVNALGSAKDTKNRQERYTTEVSQDEDNKSTTAGETKKEDTIDQKKQEFENKIDEITNNVINDNKKEDEDKVVTEQPSTESVTTEKPTTETPTTEPPSTESNTPEDTDNSDDSAGDADIPATPIE